ncbi:hypothetical protein ACU4HD_46805 [Cupriavidus basilensis]
MRNTATSPPSSSAAYADEDLLIQAVGTGRVFKVLEKPYPARDVRRSLRRARWLCAGNRLLRRAQRLMAVDDGCWLPFLAH